MKGIKFKFTVKASYESYEKENLMPTKEYIGKEIERFLNDITPMGRTVLGENSGQLKITDFKFIK